MPNELRSIPQPPIAPVLTEPSKSVPERKRSRRITPFYRDDEKIRIYNADSKDLSFLDEESVHLVVTSPPYNLGKDYGTARDDATYDRYLRWIVMCCRQLWRVLVPGGRLCLNIPLDINLSFDGEGKRRTHKR